MRPPVLVEGESSISANNAFSYYFHITRSHDSTIVFTLCTPIHERHRVICPSIIIIVTCIIGSVRGILFARKFAHAWLKIDKYSKTKVFPQTSKKLTSRTAAFRLARHLSINNYTTRVYKYTSIITLDLHNQVVRRFFIFFFPLYR